MKFMKFVTGIEYFPRQSSGNMKSGNSFHMPYALVQNPLFITYLLLYPVDITHYINFNYYTVYFYATHNVKHVTWRPVLPRVDCDVTNKRQFYVVCLQS
jgi:hypothetical protein